MTSDVDLAFAIGNPALTVTDGTDTVAAQTSQIENLVGGQGNDTFAFQNGVQLGGTLDGGAGTTRWTFPPTPPAARSC